MFDCHFDDGTIKVKSGTTGARQPFKQAQKPSKESNPYFLPTPAFSNYAKTHVGYTSARENTGQESGQHRLTLFTLSRSYRNAQNTEKRKGYFQGQRWLAEGEAVFYWNWLRGLMIGSKVRPGQAVKVNATKGGLKLCKMTLKPNVGKSACHADTRDSLELK